MTAGQRGSDGRLGDVWRLRARALGLGLFFGLVYFLPQVLLLLPWPGSARGSWPVLVPWLFALLQAGGFVLAVVVAVRHRLFAGSRGFFGPGRLRLLANLGSDAGLLALSVAGTYLVMALMLRLGGPRASAHQQWLDSVAGHFPLWFSLLSLGVVAPVFEELIFRACLYRLLGNRWLAFLVSVLAFALAHTGLSAQACLYLPASLCVTLAYHREKRLLDSILVHCGNNLFQAAGILLLNSLLHLLPA